MTNRTRGVNGRCKICTHPDRWEAERLICAGAAITAVARKFEMEYYGLRYHWLEHVTDSRKAALTCGTSKFSEIVERTAHTSGGLLDDLEGLRNVLFNQIATAHEANDRPQLASLAGRAIECLREISRLNGHLTKHVGSVTNIQNNFILSPAFTELQATLITVLKRYPEARREVVRAFRELETRALTHQPEFDGTAEEVPDHGDARDL